MTTHLSPWVDLRGFRWRLEPLRRKLRSDADAARLGLAALVRQEQEVAAALALLDVQFLQDAKAVLNAPLDPDARGNALMYLMGQGQELERRRREAAELRSRIIAAREGCMTAERRLRAIERMRGTAQAEYASEQMRGASRQADAAWIAAVSRQVSESVAERNAS